MFYCLISAPAFGQDQDKLDANDPAAKNEDKRIVGVIPNYRTAETLADYHPISAKYKLTIAFKDSFDYPLGGLGAMFAGLYQLENVHPQFGQGMAGYFRRLGTSYADQAIGNMLTEGIMPSLLREDPRYFRKAQGSVPSRVFYALSRSFVTKRDSGRLSFNFSEVVGNGMATAIGLSYYSDSRDARDFSINWGTQLAADAAVQVAREFWPDIKRRWMQRKKVRE